MSVLTSDQLARLHTQLGTDGDETDWQARYTRLGNVRDVAVEVVRQRLADLLASPVVYSVSGVYSENNADRVRALREQLTSLAGMDPDLGDTAGGDTPVLVTARLKRRGRAGR